MNREQLIGPTNVTGEGNESKRRAATLIMVAVLIPVLIGFAAITIDVGAMYSVRTDLQNSADAAALAAVSAYAGDSMIQVRLGYGGDTQLAETMTDGNGEVNRVAALNHSFGIASTSIDSSDVQYGWIDVTSGSSPLDTGAASVDYNAARVTVRRSTSGGNGALNLFFAPIFGRTTTDITASAVAVLDDRFSGFDTGEGGAALLPLTISDWIYDAEVAAGNDDYDYDPVTGTVGSSSDGVGEINLYPYVNAPGNFGLLNIGMNNASNAVMDDHMQNGVPSANVQTEIGSTTFSFFDGSGSPITYDIGGTPGLRASLESPIATHVGEVIAFFIHDSVGGNGSNVTYRITGIKFGRLMDVELNGGPSSRGVWIQPAAYVGAGVEIDGNAPSSTGTVGKLVLAR